MPVSKKRKLKNGKKPVRKAKGHLDSIFMPQWKIDNIKAQFSDISLLAEIKLGTGGCNFDDAAKIRDVINATAWVSTYKTMVSKDLSLEWVEENAQMFREGQDAFQSFYDRGNKLGGSKDPSVRYIATGDEFTKIKNIVMIGDYFISEMLEERPLTFCKLYDAMKQFLGEKGLGRVHFDHKDILRIMQGI